MVTNCLNVKCFNYENEMCRVSPQLDAEGICLTKSLEFNAETIYLKFLRLNFDACLKELTQEQITEIISTIIKSGAIYAIKTLSKATSCDLRTGKTIMDSFIKPEERLSPDIAEKRAMLFHKVVLKIKEEGNHDKRI